MSAEHIGAAIQDRVVKPFAFPGAQETGEFENCPHCSAQCVVLIYRNERVVWPCDCPKATGERTARQHMEQARRDRQEYVREHRQALLERQEVVNKRFPRFGVPKEFDGASMLRPAVRTGQAPNLDRAGLRDHWRTAQQYAHGIIKDGAFGWLILCGPVGTGKSSIAAGIVLDALRALQTAVFIGSEEIAMFKDTSDEDRAKMRWLERVNVVCVDDLHFKGVPEWQLNHLSRVLSNRHARQLPTIITCQKHIADVLNDYPDVDRRERLSDRVASRVHLVELSGKSFRLQP